MFIIQHVLITRNLEYYLGRKKNEANKIWKSNIEHLFPRRAATDDQELVHFFVFNKHMLKELHEGNAINRDNLIPAK